MSVWWAGNKGYLQRLVKDNTMNVTSNKHIPQIAQLNNCITWFLLDEPLLSLLFFCSPFLLCFMKNQEYQTVMVTICISNKRWSNMAAMSYELQCSREQKVYKQTSIASMLPTASTWGIMFTSSKCYLRYFTPTSRSPFSTSYFTFFVSFCSSILFISIELFIDCSCSSCSITFLIYLFIYLFVFF